MITNEGGIYMLKFSLTKKVRRLYQPKRADIQKWLQKAIINQYQNIHIDIQIVSKQTSQELNLQYRHKDSATNVISLEYKDSRDNYGVLYGELFLCDDVICEEAIAQHKSVQAHYAHMLIHGVLHLQGYDHQTDSEADIMERIEVEKLQELGFNNPYGDISNE